MKTPKRYPAAMCDYLSKDELYEDRARWKRKNRVKQLKQSLHKYKEGTMLPHLMSIRLAYKWMQELKKPKQNADVISWHKYLSELQSIRTHINRAVDDAAICLGEAMAREARKEQKC